MTNMMLNLDDFVRVTQETGVDITGRYDGKNYTFVNGVPLDVHKAVATHIFGFMLPELSDDPRQQDKIPALLRLGWIDSSGQRDAALETLRTRVRFEEIPPFPTTLRLRQPEESSGIVDRPPSEENSTFSAGGLATGVGMGSGGGSLGAAPTNPQRKTLGLPKTPPPVNDGTTPRVPGD